MDARERMVVLVLRVRLVPTELLEVLDWLELVV